MSFESKISTFNDLIQASFRNAMDTVESIHQTSAEMPIEVIKELGYPEDKAEVIKDSHRKILRFLYGGISNANEELGKLVVMQAGELNKFAGSILTPTDWKAPAKTTAKKTAKKTTKSTAKKAPRKKAAKKKTLAKKTKT
jgi:hypothetical protein